MNYYQQRGGFLQNIPQVTRVLLIANIAVFLLVYVGGKPGHAIGNYLALYSLNTGYFKPYQLITHMFMHGGFMHIFFNMYFGLFMFGRFLEQTMGPKRFFILYFVSGLGAAGLQLLVYYLTGTNGAMVGASGAIMGIFAAFAVYYPNTELMLLFIPVPIKAKYMLPGMVVLSLVLGLADAGRVAHFAHLGGAVVGFLLTFFWKKNQFRQY